MAGDPKGHFSDTWHAKEAVLQIYTHTDPELAAQWVDELVRDMSDKDRPPKVRSLAKALKRWKHEIVVWHRHQKTNGPTEGVNNLVKRVKRGAFGFRTFQHYRVPHFSTPDVPTGTGSRRSIPTEFRRPQLSRVGASPSSR